VPDESNPRVRILAEGSDIDAAVALFRATYNADGDWAVETTDRDFSYRHSATGDGDMTLRNTRFLGHVSGAMAHSDDYVVSWITAGYGYFDTGGANEALVIGRPFMFPTDRPVSFDISDVEQKLVHFHKPVLERVAAEHYGTAPGILHLETAPPSEAAVRFWRNTLALVSRTTLDADTSPILQAEMSRLAGVALLGMFPPQSSNLPPVLLLPSHARLRAAVEFIHANAHLPITTTGIAAIADISVRALQEGFRRHLDVTPNTYLRNVRLDRVRDELSLKAPTTVADVARAWGFAHLGRFASAYRERFGENPNQTNAR
jgi:AraC-like DNA-binding protein